MTSKTNGNLPEKKFSAGAVRATIWKNTGSKKTGEAIEYRTVSFERVYKDKQSGEWKSTNSLRLNDLPKAVVVLNKAYEHLMLKSVEPGADKEPEIIEEDIY